MALYGALRLGGVDDAYYDWSSSAQALQNYGVNGLNQVTSAGSTSFGYSPSGALASDGVHSYGFDPVYDKLTSLQGGGSSVALSYDALLRLTQTQSSTTTRFAYDGATIVAELDASNNVQRRYVPGPDGTPLLWYEGADEATKFWLLKDEHGSVIAAANGQGNVSAIDTYDPYGAPGANNAGRFQYAGAPFVPEAGLYAMGARSYSPTLGRFLQTDPSGYADGLNWYAYTHGDPVNGTDPTGLQDGSGDATVSEVVVTAPRPSGAAYGGSGPNSVAAGLNRLKNSPPQSNTVSEVVVTAKRLARRAIPLFVDLDPLLDALPVIFTPTPTAANDSLCGGAGQGSCVFSRPRGTWPGDKGSAEWGKRNGMNGKEGTRIFHGIKQGNGGAGKDDYSVDPSTGDVYDQNGDYVGNLNDGP